MLGFQHQLAGLFPDIEVEPGFAGQIPASGALLAHFDQRSHPSHVAGATRLDAAPDPALLFGQSLVEQRMVRGLGCQFLLLAALVRGIVARVFAQMATIQL